MTVVLAIDAGKTHSRVGRFIDGVRVASANGPGVEHIAHPRGSEGVAASLTETLSRLPDGPAAHRVCVGSTGLMLPSAHAVRYADVVAEVTGVPDVTVTSDVVTTFAGALGVRTGVVVAAGTGAIALGVGPAGAAQVDGWGYLVGDVGSGFDIGRQGLIQALRHLDGRGGSAPLAAAASARYGSATEIADAVHAAEVPPRLVAAFARDVADVARAGDPTAVRIWEDAAGALAETATAAASRAGLPAGTTVAWNGGLFGEEELLRRPFAERLRASMPGVVLRAPEGDAVDGACQLTLQEGEHPLLPLLHRRGDRT